MIEINKIYKGDCLDIIKNIDKKSIDIIITDPPYIHEGKKAGVGMLDSRPTYDRKDFNMREMSDFTEDKIYEFLNLTKPLMKKPQWYVFCNEKQIPYYTNWALQNKLKFNIIVWCKPYGVTNRERYSTNIEYIVRIYGNGCALNKLDMVNNPEYVRYYSKWKDNKRINGKNKLHPSEKPMDLINEIIQVSTNINDIVLDCYTGSGTIPKCCKDNNRNYIGVEKEDMWYNKAYERLGGETNGDIKI